MATIQQVQKGLARFVDTHVAGAYSGAEKIAILGGTTLIASGLPNLLKYYGQSGVVGALGLYDPDTGIIDVDSVYNAFVPHMGAEKIPIKLPKFGSIDLGTLKLGREEIDILVRYIREA